METATKILVNGAGLYVASIAAKPGVEFRGSGPGLAATVLAACLIFGLLNTFNRPVVERLVPGRGGGAWPVLGAVTFAANVLALWAISAGSGSLTDRFHIQNIGFGVIGGLIATSVSLVLHALLRGGKRAQAPMTDAPAAS